MTLTRVSEVLTALLQSQIDAARTAVKTLITPISNAAGHGATGDGTTNDTSAVQSAIDTAVAAGRKVVYLPKGTYSVTSLTSTSSVIFVGDQATFSGVNLPIRQLGDNNGFYNVKDWGAAGNGTTDDTTKIQATINAVPSTGGIVFFPPGSYLVTAMLTLPSNITVMGVGASSIIKGGSSASVNLFRNSDTTSGNTLITIKGLRFQLAALNYRAIRLEKCTKCLISEVVIEGPNQYEGISLYYGSYNTIKDCNISGVGRHGIWLEYSDKATLEKVTSTSNTNRGIYVISSDYCTIDTCYAQGNGQYGIEIAGQVSNTAVGCTMVDCRAISNTGSGLIFESYVNNSTMAGCVAIGNTESGIYTELECYGNTYTGNTSQGNGNYGLIITYGAGKHVVSGNTIRGNSYHGIVIQNTSDSVISGNVVEGNGTDVAGTWDGIWLNQTLTYTCEDNIIAGNRLKSNGRDDIRINNTCGPNLVHGNIAKGTRTGSAINDLSAAATLADNIAV